MKIPPTFFTKILFGYVKKQGKNSVSVVRHPVILIPKAYQWALEGWCSLKRIESFLNSEEMAPHVLSSSDIKTTNENNFESKKKIILLGP